ncbi:MAG TPA: DNA/RNA helicase domain-containing protein, partial [Arenimonas sp.]|nr:DNA/RNA helicase domain-containing protein [Arenimonas sp.]
IICLVGGGQEINTGEAGISAWIEAIVSNYPEWDTYISTHMTDSEYQAESAVKKLNVRNNSHVENSLHLSVSMRSFRAEKVSSFVKSVLDLQYKDASILIGDFQEKYPIKITRSLDVAKMWIRKTARANQRYGMVVSSQASRLKPLAIDIRVDVDPKHWFLGDKNDVRSSWYLEDVATEFVVQGLELDWVCMVWDADFRLTNNVWKHSSFVGDKWQNIHKHERQAYLKNAYRVLLTRARQGMVIVVPEGANDDPTRAPHFYDETYQYLKNIGLEVI